MGKGKICFKDWYIDDCLLPTGFDNASITKRKFLCAQYALWALLMLCVIVGFAVQNSLNPENLYSAEEEIPFKLPVLSFCSLTDYPIPGNSTTITNMKGYFDKDTNTFYYPPLSWYGTCRSIPCTCYEYPEVYLTTKDQVGNTLT